MPSAKKPSAKKPSAGKPSGGRFIISFEGVTLRIRDRKLLPGLSWTVRPGEQWAVVGPNGCGKSTLARTAAGELPSAAGRVRTGEGERVALVSFERQQAAYLRDLENDAARYFSGNLEGGLTPRELIEDARGASPSRSESRTSGALEEATAFFGLGPLLDRPFRRLSAGEMRKALILRALAASPTLLILDEPFDGLDRDARGELSRWFDRYIRDGGHLVLVTHRADEILPGITHLLLIGPSGEVRAGPVESTAAAAGLAALYNGLSSGSTGSITSSHGRRGTARSDGTASSGDATRSDRTSPAAAPVLVQFRDVTVTYEGRNVLDRLNWTLRRGERWGIFGPNGSGKTTIINLIAGDNLQAYANDITIFGRKRGSGESIWELRRRIGVVAPLLQMEYAKKISALEVVLSGFDGSIGLYRRPTPAELSAARDIIGRLGISPLSDRPFPELSYGQRRLVLTARAEVKRPELLLLDEPGQGLDPANRRMVIASIDAMCAGSDMSLVYITHHDDEYPSCLTDFLLLDGAGGASVG